MLPMRGFFSLFDVQVGVEKLSPCPSCGAALPPHEGGPGRPAVYCSEPCRRLAEFRIRALCRRIEKYELEQREVKAGNHSYYEQEDYDRRLRALRTWIKRDNATLRALLGGKNQIT